MNDGYDSYRAIDLDTQVSCASPYQLVLVLFDGLLDELSRARGHIEARHFDLKGQSLEKCMNIINALNSTLDHEQGGELVISLSRLYDYCLHRLVEVSASLSISGIDEVMHLLEQIREGWEGVNVARS